MGMSEIEKKKLGVSQLDRSASSVTGSAEEAANGLCKYSSLSLLRTGLTNSRFRH